MLLNILTTSHWQIRERDASNIRDALAVFFTIPEGRTLGSGRE